MNYYKIPSGSLISEELLEFAKNAQNWQDYYNFKTIQVHPDILLKDPFLVNLYRLHQFTAGIVKLNPNVCYNWHIDTDRGVGVNMLLTPKVRSHCLFAKGEGVQFGFEELAYDPDSYYLFNTQTQHMVLNFAEKRYLFTLEFAENKDQLSFDDLYQQIKKNPTW